MENKRLRTLATEIFKTINNNNPSSMQDIFSPKGDPKIRPMTSLLNTTSQQSMGTTSFQCKILNIYH